MFKEMLEKINWKVRFQSKWFWMSLIAAVILIITKVAAIFGIQLDAATIEGQLQEVAEAILVLLMLLGVPIDFTTEGIGDSAKAMTYDKPHRAEDDKCMTEAD